MKTVIYFTVIWIFVPICFLYAEDGFTQRDRELLIELKVKVQGIDKRFDQVDRMFDQIDKRFELVDRRLVQIDKRIDTRFGDYGF